VKEAALGLVVVKQQLLVHAGASGDLLNASPRKAAPRELLAGGGADP
jgi:hypothetical protein